MNTAQIAYCQRCGLPCRVADHASADALLLQHATKPEGLCADCATTQFLKHGPMAQFLDDPSKLLAPHVQQQFARLMASGNADAEPEELNWQRIVENWALPFKKPRRRGGR